MKNVLMVLGGGALLFYLARRAGDKVIEGLSVDQIKLTGAKFLKDLSGAEINISLDLMNRNTTGGKLESFTGSLLVGGENIAALSTSLIEILPAGITSIPILATIKFIEVGGNIAQLIGSGKWINGAKVIGTIKMANGITIPVDKNLIQLG